MKQYILFGLSVFFIIMSAVLTEDTISECGEREENPTKPCPENDLSCVREYFQNRSHCISDLAPISDTMKRHHLKAHLPFFNLTCDQTRVTIGGLNSGKIVDFFVDFDNNLSVLTVDFVNITIKSQGEFIYFQTAKQPRYISTPTEELYPSLTITTIFFSAARPYINRTYSVANITAPNVCKFGPCVDEATDPVVVNLFKIFHNNINVAIQEAFDTRARILAFDFIQKNLCNYGAKP